ncbi:MAG: urease accessory protein UreD [Succinivibrio sp.]
MSIDTWQASISLEFKKDGTGRSVMTRNRHIGPLVVQKPFYPEIACHVYLLHPPGGIAGCDSLSIEAKVEEGAQVLLTTPGATKFYKTDGTFSRLTQSFFVSRNCSFEFLPAQNIYYKGTHTFVKTVFDLEDNAKFIFRDVSKCGMKDEEQPFEDSFLFNSVSIRQNGREKLIETSRVDGQYDLYSKGSNNGSAYVGTYISNAVSQSTLESIREYLLTCEKCQSAAGITDEYLVVRFLSHDNEPIEKAIVKIWEMTRTEVVGLAPCHPRVWST